MRQMHQISALDRLVEMRGGTVMAKGEGECRGADFIVTLPLAVAGFDEHLVKPAEFDALRSVIAG